MRRCNEVGFPAARGTATVVTLTAMSPPAPGLDAATVRAALGDRPFRFRHDLVGHPLLQLEAIAAAADRLPENQVEHHLGDLPLVLPSGGARQLPVGPGRVIRDMERNGCWVALFNVQAEPAYDDLLSECLAGLAGRTVRGRSAHLFCASPDSVVPVHFDRHHNLLSQVSGTKVVSIGTFEDDRTAWQEIERGFARRSENAHVVPPVVASFELEPGDGLYIPPYTFHWVTNGPEPSVSFSCVFRTTASDRTELVHQCNARLRARGLRPRPPGSPARDRAKAALLRGRRRMGSRRTR